ncbi:hypothetical protein EG344_00725 [Chryseobacterium sp. G0162]|uniref:hypothetical protein n=1 Tax=Chryseobacterium sp. G0162 TaxID=2487063 RepID=UPI000F51434E|nr:hypothetical protein [Chryseobacterium sp. G0162]AZB07466.1 hypothetical protein EG344_00725 [Chryseobacterium sp. G0162]
MSKIQLTDNTMDVVVKMSEGNPGAMGAIMEILTKGGTIDPNAMGGLGSVLFLDTLGIYGTDIYILFSDICDRSLSKMLAVLRATQFGFFDGKLLKTACSFQDYSGREMVPVDELYKKVKERLPEFDSKA